MTYSTYAFIVFAVFTLFGLCFIALVLVGKGDPKAPGPFGGPARTSPLETEGSGGNTQNTAAGPPFHSPPMINTTADYQRVKKACWDEINRRTKLEKGQ